MFSRILTDGAAELSVPLTPEMTDKMSRYWTLTEEKNRVMNLTAITAEDEAARLHFLDSLGLLSVCRIGERVIDVGTGGGFPGVPLAIAADADMTLLDATEKKVAFLSEACGSIGVDVRTVHARAEEFGHGDERESFDTVVSRAVARLAALCELCLPLVKVGGEFIAMKSADSADEIAEAKNAVTLLGGAAADIRRYTIPGTDITRLAVVVKKIKPTPEKYPRAWGKIKKSAL